MMRFAKCLMLGVVAWAVVAPPASAVEPDAPEKLITRVDAVGYDLQKRLSATFRGASEEDKREQGALVEYFSDHNAPIWVDEKGLKPKALAAIKTLKHADEYGLNPDDYDVPTVALSAVRSMPSSEWLAEAELKLNRAVLKYAHDARMGRARIYNLSKNYDPVDDVPEASEILDNLTKTDDPTPYLLSFHPQHPQFKALRKMLAEARGKPIEEEEKPVIVPKGPVLRPGEQSEAIVVLRKRLDVPVPVRAGQPLYSANVYGSALEMAVRTFQTEKGLKADGIVGPSTVRALNGRVAAAPRNRIKLILANMERWRWLPQDLGDLHVRVNIPEYLVRVTESGKNILTERVVVGKLNYQTPIFSAPMDHVVFFPYWNVPNSIKRAEILPYLRSGGGGWFNFSGRPRILRMYGLYVKYKGREINASSVNWNRVDITQYHFYQPPGGLNVLGDVKFMFPNKHDVYLHDTQEKFYFARSQRTESHGCVRVQNPRHLAEVLLGRDNGWSKSAVGRAFAGGRNHHVGLNKKIPVHITYFTTWVDDNGKLRTFGDPYGHDSRMASALKL